MIIFKEPRVDAIAPAIVGGLIAGGATIFGGLLNNKSSRQTNTSNVYAQQQADAAAYQRQLAAQKWSSGQANISYFRQRAESQRDREMQREFAQHGVSWKAEDARSVGLDPLAAMGSNTFYSPVGKSVSPGNAGIASPGNASRSIPQDYSWLGQVGQQLGRAAVKSMTAEQLAHEINMKQLTEKNLSLDNEWKNIRNTQANMELANYGSQVSVPFPSAHSQQITGQADSVQVIPDQVVRHQSGHTAGVHAMKQYRLEQLSDGSFAVHSAIEEQSGDAMDSDLPTKARYNSREGKNVLWDAWLHNRKTIKPKIKKKGYKLRWSRAAGQWLLVPKHWGTKVNIRRQIDIPRDKARLRNPTFKRYRILK